VTLTAEGKFFLFESRKILAACDESIAAVQRMKRGECSASDGMT
jgi:hypothetical protein